MDGDVVRSRLFHHVTTTCLESPWDRLTSHSQLPLADVRSQPPQLPSKVNPQLINTNPLSAALTPTACTPAVQDPQIRAPSRYNDERTRASQGYKPKNP